MKKFTLKALVCTLCASLALVTALALTGCSGTGTDPEEEVRAAIAAEFDAFKNLEGDVIDELAEEMGKAGLDDYGIEADEYIVSMFEGFDYSIDDIAVEGDTATATITVMSKSLDTIANPDPDAMYEAIADAIMSGEVDPNDNDAVIAWSGAYVMGLLDAVEPTEKTIELTYTNGDDGWQMEDSSESEIEKIFLEGTSATASGSQDEAAEAPAEDQQEEAPVAETETTSPSSTPTTSQQNALESAKRYLDYTYFSHDGLIGQLEYEEYSTEDATWAADNCGADWNAQALGKAQDYLDYTSFSYTGLIGQLEYEGFTTEQATYAADSCGADWNEQAAKKAQDYLDYSSFSRDGLIGQLEYEGFTHEQAVFGVDSVGL